MMNKWYSVCALALVAFLICGADSPSTQYDQPDTADTPAESGEADIDPDIAVVPGIACWIDGEGTLECAGEVAEDYGDPPDGTFRSVSIDEHHACAVDTEGTLQCWGPEEQKEYYQVPDPSEDVTYQKVSLTRGHTCANRDDGVTECWERFDRGAGSQTLEAGFTRITNAGGHACGLDDDGAMYCWYYSQDRTEDDVLERQYQHIAADRMSHCAIDLDDTIECTNNDSGDDWVTRIEGRAQQLDVSGGTVCSIDMDNQVQCWHFDADNEDELPDGEYAAVALADDLGCATDADGDAMCFGEDVGDNGGPRPPEELEVPTEETYDEKPTDNTGTMDVF